MNTFTQALPQIHAQLDEKDLLSTILVNQKRVSREYTTACLEANCSKVRQVLHQLANDTIQCHDAIFNAMNQMNYYSPSSSANRQEVQKKLQQHTQAFSQAQHFMTQLQGNAAQQNYTFTPSNNPYPRY